MARRSPAWGRWLGPLLCGAVLGSAGCGGDAERDVPPVGEAGAAQTPVADAGTGGTAGGGGAGGGAAPDGSAGGSAGGLADASPGAACASGTTEPGAVCVTSINGRVVDEAGAPLEGFLVTACGPERCDPGTTDAEGRFEIPVGFRLVPSGYSVLVHGRPERAAFYFRLPAGAAGPSIDVGTLPQLLLPTDGPGLVVDRAGAPAQQLVSGEVTLETPAASFVRVDVESATFGAIGEQFRAVRVPEALVEAHVGVGTGITAVYGFEPFEARVESPDTRAPLAFRLRFEGAGGLGPNAAVDVLALGTFVYPDWLTPAAFEPVATAHVTPDGAAIEMDPGQGLRYLTWVALRPAR